MRSLISLAVMERGIVLRFGTSTGVRFCFQMLHPGLVFDGFEDVLNRELQQGEAAVHPIDSEWALLTVREWLLFESAFSVTLDVDQGVFELRLQFCFVVAAVER